MKIKSSKIESETIIEIPTLFDNESVKINQFKIRKRRDK